MRIDIYLFTYKYHEIYFFIIYLYYLSLNSPVLAAAPDNLLLWILPFFKSSISLNSYNILPFSNYTTSSFLLYAIYLLCFLRTINLFLCCLYHRFYFLKTLLYHSIALLYFLLFSLQYLSSLQLQTISLSSIIFYTSLYYREHLIFLPSSSSISSSRIFKHKYF